MILDNTAWAELYAKFRTRLINGLNGNYCFADREDAHFRSLVKRSAHDDREMRPAGVRMCRSCRRGSAA